MDRSLPDKAIDLIDEASSKAKVIGKKKPDELVKLEEDMAKFEVEKKEALFAENFEKASDYRDKIAECQKKIKELQESYPSNGELLVTSEDICNIISQWTKIPVSKITENERERLLKLEDILHKRVIGQEEGVSKVCDAILRSRAGIRDPKRPIGSFMFLGPTGVGKTELAKALAASLFDDEKNIVRIDMSEYMEKYSVSRLIGAPPGYIGYDEGGQLTEAVRRKPYAVVLFDEIEKAHPDVFNVLLQVLDDGRITDSQGRTVDFKNTIIIMTSNLGSDIILEGIKDGEISSEARDTIDALLKRSFRPEFLNRLDEIICFKPLTRDDVSKIVDIAVAQLSSRLEEQRLTVKVTDAVRDYIRESAFDPIYGARPIKRFISSRLETLIAKTIIKEDVEPYSEITVDLDGDLVCKVIPPKK